MDEIGNWIYIIFIAVAVISSLYKSTKKKTAQQQTQMPDPALPPQPSYSIPPVPKEKRVKIPPPASEFIKNRPSKSPSLFSAAHPGVTTESIFVQEEEHVLVDGLDLSDVDALRKAIIYSEIINRKY